MRITIYTRSREWSSLEDKIRVQTYYDPQYAARLVNLTHYVWYMDLEVSSKGANPSVHRYAVVDVNTDELYVTSEFKFFSVG